MLDNTSGANHVQKSSELRLRVVAEAPGFPAGHIRECVIASGWLSKVIEETLKEELKKHEMIQTIRTLANPYLSDGDRERLDDRGVIRIGSTVYEGDTLVSIIDIYGPEKKRKPRTRDNSWEVPSAWDQSKVVDVQFESSSGRRHEFPRGILEKYRVTLRREIPFYVGDELEIGGQIFKTTGLLSDEQMPRSSDGILADVIVTATIAHQLGLAAGEIRECEASRVDPSVIDLLTARATGQYSLITSMPIGGKWARRCGLQVTSSQLQWLYDRRLFALLGEFTSLRSQDIENRPKLKMPAEGTSAQEDIVPAAPESLFEVHEYFWGLGLGVSFSSESTCVGVTLHPASDTEIRERSHGEIRKPETLNYRTLRPCLGGLFCETVFGRDGSLHRRRRAGHIELSEPVIPFLWRHGQDPILAKILAISKQNLEDTIAGKSVVFTHNRGMKFEVVDQAEHSCPNGSWANLGTGSEAIQSLLRQLPQGAIPAAFGPSGELFLTQTVMLPPADFRPIVMLNSGNFATSDLNDIYRVIINRNNRLRKLKELNAPDVIIHNEIRQLQLAVDQLHANSYLPPSRQILGNEHRPLRCLFEMLTNCVLNSVQRRVEWCGQARGLTGQDVKSNTVHIPAGIYDELRLNEATPILLSSAVGQFLARYPHRVEGPTIIVRPDDSSILQTPDALVVVHRPISPAAILETQQILGGTPPSDEAIHADDWCQPEDPALIMQQIAVSAVDPKAVSMTSLHGIALFGTGATTSELPPDAEIDETIDESHWIDPQVKEPRPQPTMEEMADVIRRHERLACLMTVEQTRDEPPPKAGRIGGSPMMPLGSKWPVMPNGEPYEFVGQFPLDKAREVNCLPFDVPAGALLTVFSNDEWDCCATTRDGSLIIHGSENLYPLKPPQKDYTLGTLCQLIPEVVQLSPSLQEGVLIVDWELESPDLKTINSLREGYEEKFLNPQNTSRIGGHPHWIQSVMEIEFVAQICTDGVSDLMFGDGGAMYIYGNSLESMEAFIQSY